MAEAGAHFGGSAAEGAQSQGAGALLVEMRAIEKHFPNSPSRVTFEPRNRWPTSRGSHARPFITILRPFITILDDVAVISKEHPPGDRRCTKRGRISSQPKENPS
jgi:hypothetical protein